MVVIVIVIVAGDGVSTGAAALILLRAGIFFVFSTSTREDRGGEGGEGFATEVLLGRWIDDFVGEPYRASDRGSGCGEGEGGEAGADGMRGTVQEKGSHDRKANAGWTVMLAKLKKGTGPEGLAY